MILDPGRYAGVPVYALLEALSRGYIAADRRFLRAVLDRPSEAVADVVRFAAESHESDPVDVSNVLLDLFRHFQTPDALPFLVAQIRANPEEISDELVEALSAMGAAAIDPLLALIADLENPAEVPFVLAALRARDPRILEALTPRLERDAADAALWLEMYGDPAAVPALQATLASLPAEKTRERHAVESAIAALAETGKTVEEPPAPFDIVELYPEEATPEFEILSHQERLAMLESPSAAIRLQTAESYKNSTPVLEVRARLLEMAKSDPDLGVRGASWEALEEANDEPEIKRAMLAVLKSPEASVAERGGVAVALAQQSDNPAVFEAINALYADPQGRLKALKAMSRSLDKRFAAYPPRHLDDPDPALRSQAIWGVGYLGLTAETPRLEKFFDDEEFRSDALFAYALASPGETSPGRVPSLLKKIEKVSGGLSGDETDLVKLAIDQRLMLAGHKAVFFPDDEHDHEHHHHGHDHHHDHGHTHAEAPAATTPAKVGRNDPCPCGSGKKFKKCCGVSK